MSHANIPSPSSLTWISEERDSSEGKMKQQSIEGRSKNTRQKRDLVPSTKASYDSRAIRWSGVPDPGSGPGDGLETWQRSEHEPDGATDPDPDSDPSLLSVEDPDPDPGPGPSQAPDRAPWSRLLRLQAGQHREARRAFVRRRVSELLISKVILGKRCFSLHWYGRPHACRLLSLLNISR